MNKLINTFVLPRLHRLARRQDENFLTESFAHLLEVLLEFEPSVALQMLELLFPKNVLAEDQLESVSVDTQVITKSGIPDIVIRAPDVILYVEAKVDSSFGYDQLARYRADLDRKPQNHRFLVTLTRFSGTEGSSVVDHTLRWYEIADFLSAAKPTTGVGRYLRDEYLNLLKYRCVTMDKVTWELGAGMRAYANLIEMIGEAVRQCGVAITQRSATVNYQGFIIDDGNFYVGVYLDDANRVCLETKNMITNDDDLRSEAGSFEGGKWKCRIDLSTEESHFFARSRRRQLQFLEDWVKESVGFGRTIIGQDA